MKLPTFSIIVPIYNTSAYLEQCLQSIKEQTYPHYEVILIDDGSTDNSGKICDSFQNACNCVKVLHTPNRGLAEARNLGMSHAENDYIVFVDSDDYIERDSLEQFAKAIAMDDPDVMHVYGYHFSEKDGVKEAGRFRDDMTGAMTGTDFFAKVLYQNEYSPASVYYIFKRDFMEDNHLRFLKGIYHEDDLWTPELLYHAQRMIDLKYRFYYVRVDNYTSITRDSSKAYKRAIDRMCVSQKLAEMVEANGIQASCYHDNLAAQYMFAVFSGELVKDKSVHVDRFFPLRYAKTPKYVLKAFLFALSPSLACRLREMKK